MIPETLHVHPGQIVEFTLPWQTTWPAILHPPKIDVPYADVLDGPQTIDLRREDWREQMLAAYDAAIAVQRRMFAAMLERTTVEIDDSGATTLTRHDL